MRTAKERDSSATSFEEPGHKWCKYFLSSRWLEGMPFLFTCCSFQEEWSHRDVNFRSFSCREKQQKWKYGFEILKTRGDLIVVVNGEETPIHYWKDNGKWRVDHSLTSLRSMKGKVICHQQFMKSQFSKQAERRSPCLEVCIDHAFWRM